MAGPADAPAVILLHGWPDDIGAWGRVAPLLNEAGFRTIAPYLRGCGLTEFLSDGTVRDGRGVALAQDAIDLADGLGLSRFAVVGHDWGARAAYFLASLFPDRISRIVSLALPYQPKGAFKIPSFAQARRIWYQWFMCVEGGAEAVRRDPKGFARIQWETWSPPGWFGDDDFFEAARSFENPDWVSITLHGYRSRYVQEPCDSRYDKLQDRLRTIDRVSIPTLMVQLIRATLRKSPPARKRTLQPV
jgi:pimeloyl-ACP methyl ester carboxylesterase